MKKLLAVTFGLLSANSFAETPNSDAVTQPKLAFGIYDVSGESPRLIKGNTLSVSKKHRACWIVANAPYSDSNKVVETITSPKKTTFTASQGEVQYSKNGLTAQITTMRAPNLNNQFSQCWAFKKNDPKGTFSISVRINDVEFPAQTFKVVK